MPDPLYNELQKTAELASRSHSIEEGVRHLAKAFSLFSEESARLKSAYAKLQEEFQAVNLELEKANRKLLQKASELNTLSQYMGGILKNISQGILFITTDGIILSCNDAAQKILQIDPKEIIYKRCWNHFRDDFFGFSLKDALHFGLAPQISYISLSAGNSKREIEVTTSFVSEGPNPYQGIIIMLRDITEVQRLQLIAGRNDRMKELGEMVSTVAHEIKNPLGGIRGYATLLQRDLSEIPSLQEMAGYIIEGTQTLDRLLSKVLHYARPIQIQPASTELAAFIRSVCKFIKVDPAFPPNVSMVTHISQEPLMAPIDAEAMRSALLNLIVNAFQAMPNGGTLTVSLLKQDNQCLISITDTGIGIEEKDLPHLFSPFFTTKNKGNGLGLAETFKIIQAHYGAIDVRSQVARGTTFTITLPLKR